MAKDVSMVHQPQRSDDRTIATTRRTFLPTFATAVVSSAVAAPVLGHAEQPTQSETGTVSWNELRTRKPAQARGGGVPTLMEVLFDGGITHAQRRQRGL